MIARNLDKLFPGMEICARLFRVTRDADFTVSDEADDLLRAVEDELRRRRFGEVVRLEVGADMDPDMRELADREARDEEAQVVRRRRACSTSATWEIYELEGHRELRDQPWSPVDAAGVR